MKNMFIVAAAALALSAAPALANTPSADPFGAFSNDQAGQSTQNQNGNSEDAYVAPFGDHLQQTQQDGLRPMNERNRNNLQPPRIDASGVPDPRI